MSKNRVVVALSGGVDSSVCAYLLKQKGYDVIAVTMKTWSTSGCSDERSKGCCSIRDIDDARSVARKLNVPFYVMDLSADFKTKIIDYFVDEYLNGRTPNPCVECNNQIKFGILSQKAKELGAEYVATGHYARRGYSEEQKGFFVQQAKDLNKDQSYVLAGLTQEQLAHTFFPIGELEKSEVRNIAKELGLRTFDKPDSQEICFVKKSYGDFVKEIAADRLPGKGRLVDRDGKKVGSHEGSHLFTIGQRKRIKVTNAKPYFVNRIDAEKNEVVIGDEDSLWVKRMVVGKINWQMQPSGDRVEVKIRYKHFKTAARIVEKKDGDVVIEFAEAQKAVTPGQMAVFYDGDRVLGGGRIDRALLAKETFLAA